MLNGLNNQEVEYRINNGLVNNEDIKNSRSLKTIFLSNIITLFNLIHIILLILVITTGSINNITFIFAIIFNTIISIYQEIKAKIIIDNLKITTKSKVTVIRNGEEKKINPEELVLDDLLYLKQGDSLYVDALLVKSNNLEADESIITGESDSINKKKDDKLISGTIITAGSGYAKVISINRETYANNLIKEASKNNTNSSYLMKCINLILKIVTVLIIPVGILLFITQFFYINQTYSESILSTVAGIIGMIPEGLILLTSISLTVGVIKMASKKVIIQKLSGIELLACIDILCLDKTGTITDGSMEVIDVINLNKENNIDSIIATIASETTNATDIAINKYYRDYQSNINVINRTPFSSARKYSLIETDNAIYTMGALEYITNNKITDYSVLDNYVEHGYRVLSLAKCNKEFNKETNKLLGFIILKDNLRKKVKETLDYFKEQEVDIKIISGDNPKTVTNMLKQIGIDYSDKFISGNDLGEKYSHIRQVVNNYNIFGRVTPTQKQLIIRALKEKYMVGYIGDGVNDILAIKESDCGIALASGTSAVRGVSEVVLTESDFSVLPSIVNEGRRVVNNIERVASMYLIKTIYSFLISITCIILSYGYPFYPVQLSLISAICVGLPSFFLAIEPNYKKVEKNFILKVFRNALPSGICVWLNILFLIFISFIFKIDFDVFRITTVAITGYLSLRLLYNISKPLKGFRKGLVYFCIIVFYLALFIFRKFFLIDKINILSVLFMIIIPLADNYITEFLENIYDKFIIFYKKRKSRVRSEK